MTEQLVLEFWAAGQRLATPALAGLRLRSLSSVRRAPTEALPIMGVFDQTPLVPVVDLTYLLSGEPATWGLALQATAADGPIAFQIESAIDVRDISPSDFRRLPPLCLELVPRAEVWSLALVEDHVLPILLLDRVLGEGERRTLREQAMMLAAGVPEVHG